jgi:hypothetical protein
VRKAPIQDCSHKTEAKQQPVLLCHCDTNQTIQAKAISRRKNIKYKQLEVKSLKNVSLPHIFFWHKNIQQAAVHHSHANQKPAVPSTACTRIKATTSALL